MKTYCVGWSLLGPHANYLKRFIHQNKDAIGFSGIIYPQKKTDKIETTPLFDFEDSAIFQHADRETFFIDCTHFDFFHPNYTSLKEKFETFFAAKKLQLHKTGDFLNMLIKEDIHNQLQLPFEGVTSADIRDLQNTQSHASTAFDPLLDIESRHVLGAINRIFTKSNWDDILKFDQDNTLEQSLLYAILEANKLEPIRSFYIDSNAANFMDILLAFQFKSGEAGSIHGNSNFSILCNKESTQTLGDRLEFYKHAFGSRLSIIPFQSLPKSNPMFLTRDPFRTLEKSADNLPEKMISVMPKSIFDYHRSLDIYRQKEVNIKTWIRQPDTQFSHLVGMFLTL